MSKWPPTKKNISRGIAPLYGLLSTNTVRGKKRLIKTQGDSEGFDQITFKLGSNHGGIQGTLRENGDFELKFIRWQSGVADADGEPVIRGTNKVLAKGNLRDMEDTYGPDGQGADQMELWEQRAHEEYAKEQ